MTKSFGTARSRSHSVPQVAGTTGNTAVHESPGYPWNRIHAQLRGVGVTWTSWVPKSLGTLGYQCHTQLRCAGISWNSGVPKSPGTPGCRIDPVFQDARYTPTLVGSSLPKLRRAGVILDSNTRTTVDEIKRNSGVPVSHVPRGWRIHPEVRCTLVIRNYGLRDTSMSVSTWTQGCRRHPVSSESGLQVFWDISKHVFRVTGVTGSGFESRYF